MRNWSIGAKLALATFALIGTLFLTFILVSGYLSARTAEAEAVREVGDKTRLLADTVTIVDADLRKQVDTFARLFASQFNGKFSLDANRAIEVAGKQTPVLRDDGSVLNLDFSIPDRFTRLTGVFATVFVRSGDDFIRITTSHKKENGERAIGTQLDRSHPGYPLVLEGQPYAGAANLFGGQYMTRYDPIKNAEGKVIGILYVGVNFTDSMKSLADGIKSMKLGKTGFFYALNAKEGKDFGKVMIHPSIGKETMLESKDRDGHHYVKTILERKQGSFRYVEAGKENSSPRERIVAFSHVAAWNMVIAGEVNLDEVTEATITQRNMLGMIAIIMVGLVSGLLYPTIQFMVARPIKRALEIAETVAAGDLTSKIEIASEDETGRLMRSLKQMNENLAKIVGDVRNGTTTIVTASEQISSGNMDLSVRSEQQASALEETASSMEELTSTVKQNADNARQACSLATNATEVATRGGTVVAEVVATMGSINESSKKIVDIIGVIDGIAFQTNILALNAAVEAARAGEQGRGFAVVASEVRSLAQRSAAAAKEIKELIGNSVEKVESGSRLVDQAGNTMQEVVESIRRVADIMGDITAASQEQTSGIEQINQAIIQLDDTTQQNAALVEQATAAAKSLHDQAQKLSHAVTVFKLDDGRHELRQAHSKPAPRAPAARPASIARPPRAGLSSTSIRSTALANSTKGDDWEEF